MFIDIMIIKQYMNRIRYLALIKYLDYQQTNLQNGGSEYNISVRDPWFGFIKSGIKKVEGRLNRGLFARLRVNDLVVWENKGQKIRTRITKKIIYPSFYKMIDKEGIENVLPQQGFVDIDQAVAVYRQWYSEKDEKGGVVGIHLELVSE